MFLKQQLKVQRTRVVRLQRRVHPSRPACLLVRRKPTLRHLQSPVRRPVLRHRTMRPSSYWSLVVANLTRTIQIVPIRTLPAQVMPTLHSSRQRLNAIKLRPTCSSTTRPQAHGRQLRRSEDAICTTMTCTLIRTRLLQSVQAYESVSVSETSVRVIQTR